MGNVILITAPYSGIGKVLTRYYAKKEHVVILGLGKEHGKEWFNDVKNKSSADMHYFSCDCTVPSQVEQAFHHAKNTVSNIDGLIHLVGGSLLSKSIEDLELEDFHRVVDVNLASSFLVGKEAFKWMKAQNHGSMIFFSSTTAFQPVRNKLPYAVAKAGVNALTMSFALEAGAHNIIVNAIAPSYVLTDRHVYELKQKAQGSKDAYLGYLDALKQKNPRQALLYPDDMISLVDLLLTTKHIHGQVIKLDLGQTMHL